MMTLAKMLIDATCVYCGEHIGNTPYVMFVLNDDFDFWRYHPACFVESHLEPGQQCDAVSATRGGKHLEPIPIATKPLKLKLTVERGGQPGKRAVTVEEFDNEAREWDELEADEGDRIAASLDTD